MDPIAVRGLHETKTNKSKCFVSELDFCELFANSLYHLKNMNGKRFLTCKTVVNEDDIGEVSLHWWMLHLCADQSLILNCFKFDRVSVCMMK